VPKCQNQRNPKQFHQMTTRHTQNIEMHHYVSLIKVESTDSIYKQCTKVHDHNVSLRWCLHVNVHDIHVCCVRRTV